jgi:hypothetical protein
MRFEEEKRKIEGISRKKKAHNPGRERSKAGHSGRLRSGGLRFGASMQAQPERLTRQQRNRCYYMHSVCRRFAARS